MNNLWVVMPVYNEAAAIEQVVIEWIETLNQLELSYTFLIIDDGSRDESLSIIQSMNKTYSQIKILKKQNSGHGQTCLEGYRIAIQHDADWIFQIDSDGQCDPFFFKTFVFSSQTNDFIFGNRTKRADGLKRKFISKMVSIFSFAATNIWVKDANVPYRLMKVEKLKILLSNIPNNFNLVNVLLSILITKKYEIKWIPIYFRNRLGGMASVKTFSFAKHGIELFFQLQKAIKTN